MSFTSLAAVLFLLNTVATLAAVDPNSLVLKHQALNPSLNDRSDDSMSSFTDANNGPLLAFDAKSPPDDGINRPSPLTVDVTTFPDDKGTVDEAGVTNPGNNDIFESASAECLVTPNARRRVRRGCITFPNSQQSPAEVERARGPKPNSDALPVPNQPAKPQQPQAPRPWNPDQDLPVTGPLTLNPDFKIPTQVYWLCDRATYDDLNIPMCDSGRGKRVGKPLYFGPDIIWTLDVSFQHAELLHAHPWLPTFGCAFLEIAWCCCTTTTKEPNRDLMHDLHHEVDYTAHVCVVFQGEGKGPFGSGEVNF